MKTKKKSDFNGYDFDDIKIAKQIKYIAVYDGDLDLNGCYGFRNKKEIRDYFKYNHSKTTIFKTKLLGIFN